MNYRMRHAPRRAYAVRHAKLFEYDNLISVYGAYAIRAQDAAADRSRRGSIYVLRRLQNCAKLAALCSGCAGGGGGDHAPARSLSYSTMQ